MTSGITAGTTIDVKRASLASAAVSFVIARFKKYVHASPASVSVRGNASADHGRAGVVDGVVRSTGLAADPVAAEKQAVRVAAGVQHGGRSDRQSTARVRQIVNCSATMLSSPASAELLTDEAPGRRVVGTQRAQGVRGAAGLGKLLQPGRHGNGLLRSVRQMFAERRIGCRPVDSISGHGRRRRGGVISVDTKG